MPLLAALGIVVAGVLFVLGGLALARDHRQMTTKHVRATFRMMGPMTSRLRPNADAAADERRQVRLEKWMGAGLAVIGAWLVVAGLVGFVQWAI